MTADQYEQFLAAIQTLLIAGSDSVESVKLRDSEVHTGARLIWLAKESNGYVNLSHEEAMSLCGTKARSTLRYHLARLRNAGVLRTYSTNGTVRVKVAGYPGSELIVHERKRTVSTKTATSSINSRTASTPEGESSESREQHSRDRAAGQLLRAAGSRDRAAGQLHSRNFDDYPQNNSSMLVSQLDPPIPLEMETNKLTATVTDSVEEALSVALMTAAGMWMRTAKQLAKQHPFELIRRAIAFWWCNRRSTGGEFAETPGIVLTWLNNLEQTTIPPLSREFMASELYLNHMTTTERTEAEQAKAADDDTATDDDVNQMDPIERQLYWQEKARWRQS